MIRINISVADSLWSDVDKSFVRDVASAVLEQEGPFDDVEVTVRITHDDEIQKLNFDYRQVDMPTDVLSFGAAGAAGEVVLPGDAPDQLGDVVVSLPAAKRQASEYGHPLERELAWLVVHGILQLLGYAHGSPVEEQLMRHREELILASLDLSRP